MVRSAASARSEAASKLLGNLDRAGEHFRTALPRDRATRRRQGCGEIGGHERQTPRPTCKRSVCGAGERHIP